jgi:hypothetical protein
MGSMTPRRATAAWIAEKTAGKNPSANPDTLHKNLHTAALVAKKIEDFAAVESYRVSQQTLKKGKYVTGADYSQVIYASDVLEVYMAAVKSALTSGDIVRAAVLAEEECAYAKTVDTILNQFNSVPASDIHSALKKAADTAKTAGNAERMIELYNAQAAFAIASGAKPTESYRISIIDVLESLKTAATAAQSEKNPERMLALATAQNELVISAKNNPANITIDPDRLACKYGINIDISGVHRTFDDALTSEANPNRIVSLYESWTDFEATNKIADHIRSHKRPIDFTAKYEAAKKAVEASGSLVPSAGLVSGGAAPAGEMSVKAIVGLYGTMMLDPSSLPTFKNSFQALYRMAVLRLHPDKSPEDAAKFQALGAHKAWVDALTEAEFAASPKQ